MQQLEFPDLGSLDPALDTQSGTVAMTVAVAPSSMVGLCGLPRSGPWVGALCKDTLAWGVLHVVPRGGGGVHLLRVGELAHQLHLEVFPPLVLLPPVDEHFVLQRKDTSQRSQGPVGKCVTWAWGYGDSSRSFSSLLPHQGKKELNALTF